MKHLLIHTSAGASGGHDHGLALGPGRRPPARPQGGGVCGMPPEARYHLWSSSVMAWGGGSMI